MPFRACTVSFVERGQRHSAKVDAETVYEAACLALKAFHHMHYVKGPGRAATLEIETDKPARFLMELKVEDVLDWLYYRPARTPATKERKKRLRALLADDRR
jgi:hypothetical protein